MTCWLESDLASKLGIEQLEMAQRYARSGDFRVDSDAYCSAIAKLKTSEVRLPHHHMNYPLGA